MRSSQASKTEKSLHGWDDLDCIILEGKNSFTTPIIKELTRKWEKGKKNSLIYIDKFKGNGDLFAIAIDKSGDIIASATGEDFDEIIKNLKLNKYIPRNLVVRDYSTYFNRLIWEDLSKNTLILIKQSRGNGNKRFKKPTNKFVGRIITMNRHVLFKRENSTLKGIKSLLRESRLLPTSLAIKDKYTYFNRIKKNLASEMIYRKNPK